MRTKKTLKNSIYIIIAYFMVSIISLLTRKLFVMYLPLEFLGYEGLFGNIFAVLSLVDLGIDTLIIYRLYPAFANEDKEEIARLMGIYKYLFRIIGFITLAMGIILIPFLKFIIRDNSLDWRYVYYVYIMQLITILCTYFLAYKRLLFTIDQCNYKCVQIDTICTFLCNFARIIIILLFKSYILYLFINILFKIIANLIISIKANKEYSYINRKIYISREELINDGFRSDMKNNVIQKIAAIIYGSTDNIVISIFLGIKPVALLGNYSIITGNINTIIDKILESFQASIGNYIYSDNANKIELFHMFELFNFILANFISISYFFLLNPLIEIWLGSGYIFGISYIITFVLNEYIKWNHKFVAYYRYAFGKYEMDRNYILFGAILNLICSVLLAKPLGISGIIIGTIIGNIGFWTGRVKVVYTEYLDENIKFYIFRQIRNIILFVLETILIGFLCSYIPNGIKGFLLKILICLFIPNLINLIIFYKTKEMKMIIGYVYRLKYMIKDKIVQRE